MSPGRYPRGLLGHRLDSLRKAKQHAPSDEMRGVFGVVTHHAEIPQISAFCLLDFITGRRVPPELLDELEHGPDQQRCFSVFD